MYVCMYVSTLCSVAPLTVSSIRNPSSSHMQKRKRACVHIGAMLQLGKIGVVTELIRDGNLCFVSGLNVFKRECSPTKINLDNVGIEMAFLSNTCGRFRRPFFFDSSAWTNYG